jgi:hypothetical protein
MNPVEKILGTRAKKKAKRPLRLVDEEDIIDEEEEVWNRKSGDDEW